MSMFTIDVAGVLDVSHHDSHESVKPLSHWVGRECCCGGPIL